MGAEEEVNRRVVFDTTVVVSALLFPAGRLAWLREHWRSGGCLPIASRATIDELVRVLRYPKFQLSNHDERELLGDYLPFCELVERTKKSPLVCRDPHDQPFLDLAQTANAEVLVTGDRDLLALVRKAKFAIETAEEYRQRVLR